MKTLGRLVKIIAATIAGFFGCIILYVWAGLAWIAFRPLPPVPRYGIQYAIQDNGPVGSQYMDFYGDDPLDYGWRLTAGKAVQLSSAAQASDKARRTKARLRLAERLGFHLDPDAVYDDNPVVAVCPNGHALVYQGGTVWLWQQGRFVEPVPRSSKGFYKARGYSWPIYDAHFHEMDVQDVAIGNGRIATGYATSGGTSSPHGRWMPLVWRPGYRRPEDLNSRIDPSSGWYLDQAVDTNGSGQILCVGRRTDMKGAEQYDQADAHWLVLTPH